MKRLVVSLAVLAIPGALLLWMVRTSVPERGVLPDGSVVRLLNAIYGTTNAFTTKKFWHEVAREILPGQLKKRVPPSRRMVCSNADSLNLYFIRTDPATEKFLPVFWRRVEAIDEAGFVYLNYPGSCS